MLIGCLTSEPLQLLAGQQGAAIFVNSTKSSCQAIQDCTFDISQSSFEDNAGVLGGAIDMTVDSLAVRVTNSNFTRNSAQTSYAGGINLDRPTHLPNNADRRALKVKISSLIRCFPLLKHDLQRSALSSLCLHVPEISYHVQVLSSSASGKCQACPCAHSLDHLSSHHSPPTILQVSSYVSSCTHALASLTRLLAHPAIHSPTSPTHPPFLMGPHFHISSCTHAVSQ